MQRSCGPIAHEEVASGPFAQHVCEILTQHERLDEVVHTTAAVHRLRNRTGEIMLARGIHRAGIGSLIINDGGASDAFGLPAHEFADSVLDEIARLVGTSPETNLPHYGGHN